MIYLIGGLLLGLIPGIHPNLIINFPFSRTAMFQIIFASLFSGIVPALLFVPTPESSPSMLPGQKMMRKGRMGEAVMEYALGALLGTLLFVIFSFFYPQLSSFIFNLRKFTFFFLILFLIPSFIRERRKWEAIFVFLISGIYGALILSSVNSERFLLAHFSGMFGLTGILLTEELPQQSGERKLPRIEPLSALYGTVGGLLISLFPGLTPAQVASFLFYLFGAPSSQLVANGSLTSSSFLFSFLSLYYLGKGRMAAVEKIALLPGSLLLPAFASFSLLFLLLPAVVRMSALALKARRLVLLFVLAVVLFYSRFEAIFLLPSFLLGLLPYRLRTGRVHLMGSLALPTLLYYFGKLK